MSSEKEQVVELEDNEWKAIEQRIEKVGHALQHLQDAQENLNEQRSILRDLLSAFARASVDRIQIDQDNHTLIVAPEPVEDLDLEKDDT